MEKKMIEENLKIVHKKIKEACERAGRDESEVTLIAVSKTKPIEDIKRCFEAGERNFGENKVQELDVKIKELPEAKWHMIGHLQRNKVKNIIGKVELIHSLESERLAIEINKQSEKAGLCTPVLVKINIGDEESKFGIKACEAKDFIKKISTYKNLKVKGLMTVAPYVENNEDNRVLFRKMYDLFIDIKNENIDNVSMDILSMGMTNDYEIAIEEGATVVRVGTGIFGARDYTT
jgi:pyridoxal phosphate enzyme (YggS family)